MDRAIHPIRILFLLIILLGSAREATAHDKSAHQGHLVKGTVSAMSGDTITLTTETGALGVELSAETKISRDDVPASRDQLKPGETIELEGPKLPGGRVAAREVWIRSGTGTKIAPAEGKEDP